MAGDYGTMVALIASQVRDTSIDTEIKQAIQDAISLYEPNRFYFNQVTDETAAFSTVANREYYDGTDLADIPLLVEINSMVMSINGIKIPMGAEDFRQMDRAQSGSLVGPPKAYAYYAQQIRLYPIPDAVYQIYMAYHHRLTPLVNDADTNAWMTDAEMLIRQSAKIILALDVMQEPNIATNAAPLRDAALARLEKETRKRRSNPRLKTDLPMSYRGGDVRSGEVW